MSWLSRLKDFSQMTAKAWRLTRSNGYSDPTDDDLRFLGEIFGAQSVTGVHVNQQTALNASAVMACVTMLAEDVAKLPWGLFREQAVEAPIPAPLGPGELPPAPVVEQVPVTNHYLADLLEEPNDWQDDLEFREQLQLGLIMRGNGYAVIIRNGRGIPISLVPMNPDRTALWEAPTGDLFYRVTPLGLHEMSVLRNEPLLIPFADMLHIRGFSLNGLLGASRITLAKEAIGLTIAQEQKAARWMGNAVNFSGMITPDKSMTPDAAKRLADNLRDKFAGLQNVGKLIIGEEKLNFTPFSMSSTDLEFIASRQFQLQDVARIFRIPPHMIGELSRSTNNNITQQAQEYANYTLSGYTTRWKRKFRKTFGLRAENLNIGFDLRELIRGDIVARYNAYRTGIMSMFLAPDEARIDDGLRPKGGDAAKLQKPTNMAAAGSQSTGTPADAGGRPEDGTVPGL